MKLLSQSSIALAISFGSFLWAPMALAAPELMKSADFGTVYYVDSRNIRHPFPTERTYRSWYGNDFSNIVTVSNEVLQNFPLGKNITIRPGTYLVKVRTAPEVYAVEQGGVLRVITDEGIAAAIYGDDWASRVVDIPDVFFGDYSIGKEIRHDYTIPNSILFKDPTSDTFFYKEQDILRKFESIDAVRANYLDPQFAFSVNRSFFIRERPITGRDKKIFNPAAEPITDRRDCEARNLRAAVVVVGNQEVSAAEIDKIQNIKKAIPGAFAVATRGLSDINVEYPTIVLLDDGFLLDPRADGTMDIKNETITTFYDNHEDIFDYIILFSNFTVPTEVNSNEIAHFVPITNRVEGINKANLDSAAAYGSTGKLKGVIVMGNINKYNTATLSGLTQTLEVINHEILHTWAGYINFTDAQGNPNSALLRSDDKKHWSIYAGFMSPLGGSGWVDNGNGTFTSGLLTLADTQLRSYSDLDLYLMGLIPSQLMSDVWYVQPSVAGLIDNTIAGTKKTVSIQQIVDANGTIACSRD